MRAVARSRAEPNRFARELFGGLPRRYDVLEDVLSFGQNRRWRTAMVDAVVASHPARVLDVGSGQGELSREIRPTAFFRQKWRL